MQGLDETRKQIDEIDRSMAELFEKRMQAAKQVAEYKTKNNVPVLDNRREQAVLAKNTEYIKNKAYKSYYADFMQYLIGLSRQYQTCIMGMETVCYQGVEGGFGQITAAFLFPHANKINVSTFAEVFDNIKQGKAAFGVVPFENSTTGDVSDVLDLCYANQDIYVTAMCDIKAMQNLLALPGTKLADIKKVYSHPQALQQSARFLTALGAEQVPYANTAMAAKFVAESGDNTIAAVGSLEAGAIYGLEPIAKEISTETHNTTRFIIISKKPAEEGNRFAILVTIQHGVGSLEKVITTISRHGFDMECIKSRPMPGKPWEYYFYIELVGTPVDEGGKKLLQELAKNCLSVRMLGVYNLENVF